MQEKTVSGIVLVLGGVKWLVTIYNPLRQAGMIGKKNQAHNFLRYKMILYESGISLNRESTFNDCDLIADQQISWILFVNNISDLSAIWWDAVCTDVFFGS